MQRDDYETLVSLGLSDADMSELGVLAPVSGDPSGLVDIYLRRSKKSEDLATMRGHLRDIIRWTEREGLKVRHVWFEQLSASKTYVRRLEFEKCTDAVLEGKSRTMAAWKTDRFDRRGMGQVGLMLDRLEQRRARLVCTVENLDSSQPGARMIFAFMSEKARSEAKDIALRVNTGHREHKEMNRRGTGRPPFGTISPRLEDGKPSGKVEPHPEEFKTARRLADLVLGDARGLPGKWRAKEGQPLTTRDTAHILNAEGHRTRGGHTWTPTAVSKLVQSPLFAGMVPQRERVLDEYGNPTGRWHGYGEPAVDSEGNARICGTGVITPEEFYRIRAMIRERTNEGWSAAKRKGKPGTKYLGTGIYHCGRERDEKRCGGYMSHRGGRYRCEVRQTRGTVVCLGTVTLAERVDFAVGEAWIRHVTSLEPGDRVLMTIGRRWLAFSDPETQAKKEHARTALEAAEKRVRKLEDDYYLHGRISEERYEELSGQQHATIETMSATLEALDRETDLSPLLDGEYLREAWEEADIPTRRMLLRCALGKDGVTIFPAKRQGDPTPIEDRLEYDWLSG